MVEDVSMNGAHGLPGGAASRIAAAGMRENGVDAILARYYAG
jgi:hypothetical protein